MNNPDNENTILEFSEAQQCFHFNNGNHQENTSSYKTIDPCINYDKASAFTRFIWSKYKKVTLSQIKKEYYIQKNIL
jgi:hypothetical protein